MEYLEQELSKLKYQMSILISTIDSDKYPVESLILSLNWDDDDLDAAHDIFEKYDNKIEAKEENINWSAFEHDLRDRFSLGYQSVKSIIIAFYKNDQWVEVCYQYAKAYTCVEFHSLIRDYEQHI